MACQCDSHTMAGLEPSKIKIPGIPDTTEKIPSYEESIQSIPSDLLGTQVDVGIPPILSGESSGILPEAPTFKIPANPLLPPGYQDIIDYETLQYMTGFLRTQIGKYVKMEQLIGSDTIETRYGYLVGVGINYVLLKELSTGNIMMLDFYNIKYVYVYN